MLALLAGVAGAGPVIIDTSCNAEAVAPWPAAGEGYRAQANTEGPDCGTAQLTLALVTPHDRAMWMHQSGAAGIRVLYGVPDRAAMEKELAAWIAQGEGKPKRSGELASWAEGAAGPEGFEPDPALGRAAYEALRGADRPLFCFADAPGFDTCLLLTASDDITPIGRRATR